ncbi:MAG: ferrochelatase [Phycisphaerae bacterium]|nr:ferrochelatase [Phycisphaerae bacterium]
MDTQGHAIDTRQAHPFDAVLVIAFGGPGGRDEIRPFLETIVRGRPVPPERIEEVARHYELFDGVSPLTDIVQRQAAGLRQRLAARGVDVPVFVGMRNWHPFLADVVADLARAGLRRVIGFIDAAHHCWPSCGQYREDVRAARKAAVAQGLPDVAVTYVDSWYEHEGFITANADHVRRALAVLPAELRDQARLIFTAHSIPTAMAATSRYREQLEASARHVSARLGRQDWALVYQSRSGRPRDPWLEPDICDYLREARTDGLRAAVICPIGFVADHVEVLYDLDHEALGLSRELGMTVARAATVNDHPAFLELMTDLVLRTCQRYHRYPPLPITAQKVSGTFLV